MTFKRTMCALLAASMIATGAITAQSTASAASISLESTAASVTAEATGLASNIQDGVMLHCFDWKYNDIKAEIPNIAAAGFTAVQTSPAQRDDSFGVWYMLYQPQNFAITTNALGTKEDLKALCDEAEKYGVKVVVDVVANHLRGDGYDVDESLSRGNHSDYFHYDATDINYSNRWEITHGNIGMQDLNSEHPDIQNIVLNYTKELQSVGVDGIRWDAAKHIALPSEGCDFWKVVTSQGLWHYGEILDNPVANNDGEATRLMKEYSNYISVTDAGGEGYCAQIRNAFNGGGVSGSIGNWSERGVSKDKIVYMPESHDDYSNDGEYGTATQWMDQNVIDRTYAILAAQAKATTLYFSRPSSTSKQSIMAGQKGSTHFTSKEVAEVNKFHNAMIGQKEYYVTSDGVGAVCREKGAVVVKGSGSGHVSVPNGGGTTAPGTYTDQVSGNTFTVTADTISGEVGQSGIAVLYNPSDPTPRPSTDTDTSTTDKDTDTKPVDPTGKVYIYFDNSSYNWSNVYAYVYVSETNKMSAWPGTQMTKDSATGYYVLDVSNFKNGAVIFNDGTGSDSNRYPADMQPGLDIGGSSKLFGANHSWTDYSAPTTDTDSKDTDTGKDTDTTTDTDSDTKDTKVKVLLGDANEDGKVSLRDASLALKASVRMAQLTDYGKLAADVNSDGSVDAQDVVIIQRYDIGLVDGDVGKTVEITIPV